MPLGPQSRRLVLTLHIAVSVGWIGAVAAYLSLDIVAAASEDIATLRGAYLAMDVIVRHVILPLALAALVTGILVSVGSRWGLFRHYWVIASLLLTVLATAVLVVETQTVARLAHVAADPAVSGRDLQALGGTLVHSVGGILVLLTILALNVYKPAGLTPYGWRRQQAQRVAGDS
jgi:hypothetical protein